MVVLLLCSALRPRRFTEGAVTSSPIEACGLLKHPPTSQQPVAFFDETRSVKNQWSRYDGLDASDRFRPPQDCDFDFVWRDTPVIAETERAPSLDQDPSGVDPMIHGLDFLHSHFVQPCQHGCAHARCLLGQSLRQEFLVSDCVEAHRRESLLCLDRCCLFQKCHGFVCILQGSPVTRLTEANLEILEKLFEGRRKCDAVLFPLTTYLLFSRSRGAVTRELGV